MSTTKQTWRCPICNHEYKSPIAIAEAYCPNTHMSPGRGRSGQGRMELVDGAPLQRKKVSSGDTQHRR